MTISYDSNCSLCKMCQTADEVCQPGMGPRTADIMVVSRMPNSEKYQSLIEETLVASGIELHRVFFTAVIKCRTYDQEPRKKEIKACSPYLEGEIAVMQPKYILAFGNEALQALTGHSGIMKYRGHVIDKGSYKVIPTVSPAAVMRNPVQKPAWDADVQYFAAQANGITDAIKLPKMAVIDTKEKLTKLKTLLESAELISYDIETAGLDEWDAAGGIVSFAGTLIHTMADTGETKLTVFVIPLDHPQSPFKKVWQKALLYLKPALEGIPKQIAHNGKFDAKWCRAYGVTMKVTFDTMLAAHLLDENRLKGLKPLGRMLLGVPPWGIDTKDLRNTPINQVLKYNGLDTYYTYHLYLLLKKDLIAQPRLHRLFRLLTIPANEILIETERRGIWIDRQKLESAIKISFQMRDEIDSRLLEHVPGRDACGVIYSTEELIEMGWPIINKKSKTVKLAEVNFNASNWMRWWIFEYLGMPVIERGKTKEDDSPGDPSLGELSMVTLKEMYPDHPVLKLLEERGKWQKYCSSYVTRYDEVADENDRLHTTFKLAGTVTGRLSSGKEDEEKITASKDRGRGVNLQQVPRDPFIRGLFGAPPGSSFVEADFGQIEFRLATFISRDPTGLRLIRGGVDVHLAMAARMTGKPESQVTKEERKAAKPVNFGYLYGMWWKKFMQTAKLNYGVIFTEEEAQASRKAFFDMYPKFVHWHNRQRRLVANYGRVQSPLGRIRHLPDINSADKMVQQEAERQAINSPVQSMASDMCVLGMILIDAEFKRLGIRGYTLGLVHDAINFEIDNRDLAKALPIIKTTMEHLPLKRKFGVDIDIPIEADIKVGSHWGGAKECSAEQVYNFEQYYDEFVKERIS